MNNLEKMAIEIKTTTIKISARVAILCKVRRPENDWQRGYNQACEDIASRIEQVGGELDPGWAHEPFPGKSHFGG